MVRRSSPTGTGRDEHHAPTRRPRRVDRRGTERSSPSGRQPGQCFESGHLYGHDATPERSADGRQVRDEGGRDVLRRLFAVLVPLHASFILAGAIGRWVGS